MASSDPQIWTQTIELVVPLHVAVAMHSAMCLALRHPALAGEESDAELAWIREGTLRAVRRLGVLFVERGGLTPEELAEVEREEGLEPTDLAAELVRQEAMRASEAPR